jgi:hypothetical protein
MNIHLNNYKNKLIRGKSFTVSKVSELKEFAKDIDKVLTRFFQNGPFVANELSNAKHLQRIKQLAEQIAELNDTNEAIKLADRLVTIWQGSRLSGSILHNVLPEIAELISQMESVLTEIQDAHAESDRMKLEIENSDLIRKISDFRVKVDEERVEWEQELGILRAEISSLRDKTGEIISDAKNLVEDGAEYVSKRKAQVDADVGAITAGSLSAQFSKAAAAEKLEADEFRWWTIVAMIVTIATALISFILPYIVKYEVNLNLAILKVLVLLLMSGLSAYIARESSRHRDCHIQFLQTALDLQSIEPFLAPLDKSVREKIMTDLSLKIFAYRRPNSRTEIGPTGAISDAVIKIVEKFASR